MRQERCLAVVTARGGSKGVPGKNVRVLGGRTLVGHACAAALACADIDRVIVSTDAEDIRDAALAAGATVPFLRPAELATDEARQEDAILHAMDWAEADDGPYDLLCLLEPTTPLRSVASLDRGFALLRERPDGDAVFSVAPTEAPIWTNTLRADGLLSGFVDACWLWANRQEVPPFYRLAPVVTISRWRSFRETESFLHDRTLALVVDPVEAVDVDEPLDFVVLEALFEHNLRTAADVERHVRERRP